METWSRIGKLARPRMRKEIDWKEIARDFRADFGKSTLVYRTMIHFW